MKILIWSQYFWPENFQINLVADELVKLGAEVTVLTGKPHYPDGFFFDGYRAFSIDREEYANCEVLRIPMKVRGDGSAKAMVLNYLSFVASGYIFAPYMLRKRKFDIVFVYAPSPILQTLPAIFVAWLKKVHLALWVQDLWPESLKATGFVENRSALKVVECVVRYIYRHTDMILIQSEQFRKSVAQLVRNEAKIRVFSNTAADMALSASSSISCQLDIDQYFSVVFAGNIGRAQSCVTIVAAAELLRDCPTIRFYLIGSGSESDKIAADIERKKLTNVIMPGRFPPEDMPAIFSKASALLVSLARDPALSATIPNKLQSYMSAAKPIIASLDGEAATLVNNVSAGVSCPAEDAVALARAVRCLCGMSQLERQALGQNARVYYDTNFEPKKRVRELFDLLTFSQMRK